MAVNISTDTNTVKVTATTTNTVKIVDNGNNTLVSVSQPTTRVIKVATVGPQGPAGLNGTAFPYSGSAVITGSLSQGLNTIASGGYSHAEGTSTISRGYGSHAEGWNTTSTGSWSHTEGISTMAFGEGSHAEGFVTVALGDYQHVQGAYNISSSAKTAFIIGNGTSNSTRSNLVFASGSQFQITGSLNVQGSGRYTGAFTMGSGYQLAFADQGSPEYAWIEGSSYDASFSFLRFAAGGNEAFRITSAGNLALGKVTANSRLDVSGSSTFEGTQIVTGSTRGNVTTLTISSNTASLDLSRGNFFTLQLVSGSNTYINPSNILPGQTSILTLSTTGSATVSFPSSVKQPSGSAYIPTTTTGVDILTFASTDSSTLYVVGIKNMI